MTDQSIFTNSQDKPTQAPTESSTAPQEEAQQSPSPDSLFADQLAQIKNEKGEPKYKDPNTALEALRHSQEYIPQLKSENETLKEKIARLEAEAAERQRIEDQLERFASQRQEPAPQGEAALTPEQVQQMLEQHLTQREQQSLAASNVKKAQEAIVSKYGEKAADEIRRVSQELGMSPEDMESLAAKSPDAVIRMFSATPSRTTATPPTSSYNVPPTPSTEEFDGKPKRSMLAGASSKEQMEYIRQMRKHTYKRLNIEE